VWPLPVITSYDGTSGHWVVAFGFERLGLERIHTTCDAENLASARVLEKTGMQLEGRLRHDMLIRGKWRDSLVYGILSDDWGNVATA
jgi:ribosomal-protein-alanine N-acetyltransferase